MINKTTIFLNKILETSNVYSQEGIYSTFNELVDALTSLKFKPGSVILLLFPNGVGLLKYVLAVLQAGYVPALMPPSTPSSRINAIARTFNAKAIVKNKINANAIDSLEVIVSLDTDIAILNNSQTIFTKPGEIILTTSGTSGFSSGCIFDFKALLKNAEKHANVIGLKENDVVLVNLPLFYSYAFVAQAVAAYIKNSTLVISAPPFSMNQYLLDIEKYSVTVSSITPLLIKEIIGHSIRFPSDLRVLTVGGDALDVKFIEELLINYFTNELYITYGITEAGPRVATLAAHIEPFEKLSSVGKLLPETYAQLAISNYGQNQGELLIHSNTLVKNRLGSTKPLFMTIDQKPWLRTGDIFSIDDDGYLFYKNRISDFIILKGEKINLADIRNHASKKCNAISTKINLIKEGEDLVGYDLDIIVANNFSGVLDQLHRDINNDLKLFERPKRIQITKLGETHTERYK